MERREGGKKSERGRGARGYLYLKPDRQNASRSVNLRRFEANNNRKYVCA
jgi:hypothetical protein